MPRGFAELLAVRLLVVLLSGCDRTARLEGFADAVLVGSLDTLGIGGCIRLLLRGPAASSEDGGCGSAASITEDNSRHEKIPFLIGSVAAEAPFSFQRLLKLLANGLALETCLLGDHPYEKPFSFLAAIPGRS